VSVKEKEYNIKTLAIRLHNWYLEATKNIKPESYNINAQKEFIELTDEQKFIDRYIAKKIINYIEKKLMRLFI
jgi:hypothetical protein